MAGWEINYSETSASGVEGIFNGTAISGHGPAYIRPDTVNTARGIHRNPIVITDEGRAALTTFRLTS